MQERKRERDVDRMKKRKNYERKKERTRKEKKIEQTEKHFWKYSFIATAPGFVRNISVDLIRMG